MTQSESTTVKILFRYFSDVLEQLTVETMWATIVDEKKGWYKIDNIPFYGPQVASDDIVFAEYDETELMLTYKETVQHSGNSIVQVVIMDDSIQINDIRKTFEELSCASEKVSDNFFSMEVPASIDYTCIKKKLNELEEIGVIGYAEPCLSENHRTK